MSLLAKAKAGILAGVAVATAAATSLITVTGTGVDITSGDLAQVTDANSAYLGSAFQVVELLPFIAVFAGGMYVLNKVFSIIPRAS